MYFFFIFITIIYFPSNDPLKFSSGLLGDIYFTYFNSEDFLNMEGQITSIDALISKDSSIIISKNLDGFYSPSAKMEYLYFRGFYNHCSPYSESFQSEFYYSSSKSGSTTIFVQATIIDLNDKSLSYANKELKQNWSRLRGNELERFLMFTTISIVSGDLVFVIFLRENQNDFVLSEQINKISTLTKSLKFKDL